jgi:hypothetical protein
LEGPYRKLVVSYLNKMLGTQRITFWNELKTEMERYFVKGLSGFPDRG